MAYPQSLSGLSTREEIADTAIRACLAIDSNDKALWESAFAAGPNVTLEIRGNVMKGIEHINKDCFDLVGPMDTQHTLSSIRIDVKEGANTAHMTANVLAQHFRAGEGQVPGADHLLAGTTYDIHVVKEENGQWKVKSWVLKPIWLEGNPEVMGPA